MSAFVGDVIIEDGRYSLLGPCYNDPGDVDALIYGDLITRDGSYACSPVDSVRIGGRNYDSLYDWSHDMIREIITAVGTMRAAYPTTSAVYQNSFYAQLYADSLSIGEVFARSHNEWAGLGQTEGPHRWTQLSSLLLGDPSLDLWLDTP